MLLVKQRTCQGSIIGNMFLMSRLHVILTCIPQKKYAYILIVSEYYLVSENFLYNRRVSQRIHRYKSKYSQISVQATRIRRAEYDVPTCSRESSEEAQKRSPRNFRGLIVQRGCKNVSGRVGAPRSERAVDELLVQQEQRYFRHIGDEQQHQKHKHYHR